MKINLKKFFDKYKYIILIAVVLIILIIIGFLIFHKDQKEKMDEKVLINEDYEFDLRQNNIKIENAVVVSDFSVRYYAKKNRWFIEMVLKNNSNEKVDLKDYNVYAYDKNNKVVKHIGSNTLGTLSPKEVRGVTIESKTNISSIKKITIEKK